jgi:26S proteasome regulatory subunit N5
VSYPPSLSAGQKLMIASTRPTPATTLEEKKEPVTKRDHLEAAADLMSDIQVETYSSMDKREKTEL